MTPHQIIAVAVRLFAIWLAIYTVRVMPVAYHQATKFAGEFPVEISITVIIITCILVVLWFFPRTIAKNFLPDSPPAEQPSFPAQDWFAVGCSLIGIWLLTQTLPWLIRYLTFLVILQRPGPHSFSIDTDMHVAAIDHLLQFIIALWLIIGVKGMKRLFMRLRYGE